MSSAIDDLPPPPAAKAQASGIDDLPPPSAPEAPPSETFTDRIRDPDRWKAILGMSSRYNAAGELRGQPGNQFDETAAGTPPMVLPAGALGSVGSALATLGEARGFGYAAGRTALMGAGGAASGAIQPAASHDERTMNAVKGAAIGAGAQGLAEGVGGILGAIGSAPAAMQGKAEERAFKSAGAMLKDYRKAAGKDRVNELGRYMIDNGLTKAGMTYKDVSEAADALNAQHGKAIGGILDQLDQAGASAPSHAELASKIEAQAAPLENMNTAKPTYNALQDVAADIKTMGKDSPAGNFNGAQKVKQFISDQIDKAGGWTAPNPSEKNLALRDAYHMVNGSIEDAAGAAAKSVGDDGLAKSYLAQKSGYRNSLEIAKIAKDQSLRQNANRFMSPSDYFSGGLGAVVGALSPGSTEDKFKHAAMGAGLGIANKFARTYGTPLVSTGLDVGGSLFQRTGVPAAARAIAPIAKAPVALAALGTGADGAQVGGGAAARRIADQPPTDRTPASAPARGEAAWTSRGLQRLGIQDEATAARLMADPKARALLIQASDLPAGSPALKRIQTQIQTLRSK